MRTARSVLYGGPWDGKEVHIPSRCNTTKIPTGEVYFRSERRDSENRQIYMLKLGRRTADFPKQSQQ